LTQAEHTDRGDYHLDYRCARVPKLLQSKMAAEEGEAWARFARYLKAEIDSELVEKYRGTGPLPFKPGPHSPQQPSYFFLESAMAGLLTCL